MIAIVVVVDEKVGRRRRPYRDIRVVICDIALALRSALSNLLTAAKRERAKKIHCHKSLRQNRSCSGRRSLLHASSLSSSSSPGGSGRPTDRAADQLLRLFSQSAFPGRVMNNLIAHTQASELGPIMDGERASDGLAICAYRLALLDFSLSIFASQPYFKSDFLDGAKKRRFVVRFLLFSPYKHNMYIEETEND